MIMIRLLVAVVLSATIGFERQIRSQLAGLRTHMLVCLGATLITITSVYGFNADPARVAAGIVTGIGFLGAGTIIASQGKIKGLTTAASLWIASGIGIAVGVGFYTAAIISTLLVVGILELWRVEVKTGIKKFDRER